MENHMEAMRQIRQEICLNRMRYYSVVSFSVCVCVCIPSGARAACCCWLLYIYIYRAFTLYSSLSLGSEDCMLTNQTPLRVVLRMCDTYMHMMSFSFSSCVFCCGIRSTAGHSKASGSHCNVFSDS